MQKFKILDHIFYTLGRKYITIIYFISQTLPCGIRELLYVMKSSIFLHDHMRNADSIQNIVGITIKFII